MSLSPAAKTWPTPRRDNQSPQWTGSALRVLVKSESVGAVPAIERRSVIRPMADELREYRMYFLSVIRMLPKPKVKGPSSPFEEAQW